VSEAALPEQGVLLPMREGQEIGAMGRIWRRSMPTDCIVIRASAPASPALARRRLHRKLISFRREARVSKLA
jgi:hypothetical protein